MFAFHSWIAVKPTGAQRYTQYEVVGFGVANGAPAVRIDRMGPDNYWFGAPPQLNQAFSVSIAAIVREFCLRIRPELHRILQSPARGFVPSTVARDRPAKAQRIDRTLQEEGAWPVIFHTRGATCWHPQVKGLTTMVNSIYNGWRMEDIWLDK